MIKKVKVAVRQSEGFRAECQAGNHKVITDQPAASGGSDAGPTALDLQLMALGSCMGAIARIIAQQRRLNIRGIEVLLEGDVDMDGALGKQTTARTGFAAVDVKIKLDADLSDAEKEALMHELDRRCPISDSLQKVTQVRVSLAP